MSWAESMKRLKDSLASVPPWGAEVELKLCCLSQASSPIPIQALNPCFRPYVSSLRPASIPHHLGSVTGVELISTSESLSPRIFLSNPRELISWETPRKILWVCLSSCLLLVPPQTSPCSSSMSLCGRCSPPSTSSSSVITHGSFSLICQSGI